MPGNQNNVVRVCLICGEVIDETSLYTVDESGIQHKIYKSTERGLAEHVKAEHLGGVNKAR